MICAQLLLGFRAQLETWNSKAATPWWTLLGFLHLLAPLRTSLAAGWTAMETPSMSCPAEPVTAGWPGVLALHCTERTILAIHFIFHSEKDV